MSALSRAGAISPGPDDFVVIDDKILGQQLPIEVLRQGPFPNCTFLLKPSAEPLDRTEIFRRTFNALDIAEVPTDRRISTAVRFYHTEAVKFHRTSNNPDEENDVTGKLVFQRVNRLEFHHRILPDLTAREQLDEALEDAVGESVDTVAEKATAVAVEAVAHACSEPTPADVGASVCGGTPLISGVPRVVSWLTAAAVSAFSPTAGACALGVAAVISYTTAEETPSAPPPEPQRDS